MPTIPPITGRTDRFVRFVRHRARVILVMAVLAAALFGWRAAGLELRTDFAELLPSSDPSVAELRRVQARMPGFGALIVAIESPSREANLRLAGDVAAALERLPPELVQLVAWNLRAERAFFESHRWLYPSVEDLRRIQELLEQRLERAKNPLLVDLDDGEGESLEQIKSRYGAEADKTGISSLPDGYFTNADGTFAAVIALPPKGIFAENAGERLRDATLEIIHRLAPATYHLQMKVGLSGDVMTNIEERAALENDLVWATSICVALVIASVLVFFGRFFALIYLCVPMLIGTLAAFALARSVYGYLNSSTAFLGSIIVGNGINFAIIQLARYEEERRAGVVAQVALVRSVAATMRATAIASLAAGIAYGSLSLTAFRGFSQFGVIGGAGMVFCWIATMSVLPALLWTFDRRPRARIAPRRHLLVDPAARLVLRHPVALLVLGAALSLAALALLPGYLADPFEYNFRNLRNARVEERGEGVWSRSIDKVFGRALNPGIVLTKSPAQARAVKRAILAADARGPGGPVISRVLTLEDLLPGDAETQRRKVAILEEIRSLANDRSMRLLDEEERARVVQNLPPSGLEPITPEQLPRLARWPFTEVDGTMGRAVLVFPASAPRFMPWDGHHLIQLAERIRTVHLDDGSVARGTGSAVVFAGMIGSMVRDGPVATGASAIGVILLVPLLSRGGGALLVLGTLLAGVLWMLGGAAATSQRVNFLNFVALPLTLGIGVDYGINIYLRYRLEGPGRLAATLRATGGAVALCSITTIIGYAALLVADSLALRSFGKLAILGELACLAAAAIVLPSALVLLERRGSARRTPPQEVA